MYVNIGNIYDSEITSTYVDYKLPEVFGLAGVELEEDWVDILKK